MELPYVPAEIVPGLEADPAPGAPKAPGFAVHLHVVLELVAIAQLFAANLSVNRKLM